MRSSTWRWMRDCRRRSATRCRTEGTRLWPAVFPALTPTFPCRTAAPHTRYLTISTWPVHFLGYWVRDRQLVSIEQAHYKMSAYPAWIADFKGRGTLRVGDWADIMIYDLETTRLCL